MILLVGVDLSDSTEKTVTEAAKIAAALSAKIWLLHVADPEPVFVGNRDISQYDRDVRASDLHKEHAGIQSISEKLRAEGLDATALLVAGATVETILQEAAKLNADMIVVGSHGRGAMGKLLVGSVSEGVLRKAECPVLVIPTHKRGWRHQEENA